jgi:hypothetical protein
LNEQHGERGGPDDEHITRRELGLQLRAFRNEVRVLVIGAVVVIRFDIPKEITAGALAALAAKALASILLGGRYS